MAELPYQNQLTKSRTWLRDDPVHKASFNSKAPTPKMMHQVALTLPLEGDGEGVLAVRVAHRAVVLAEVGGDHVPDHKRAAHTVRATALLHGVVAAGRAGHLVGVVKVSVLPNIKNVTVSNWVP